MLESTSSLPTFNFPAYSWATTSMVGAELRQQRFDVIDHLDRIGSRLPLDCQNHAAHALEPRHGVLVFDAVDHVGELLQANGHAILVGDDQGPVGGGARQLATRLHGEGLLLAVQPACRQVHVVALDGLHHVVETDAARGQFVGIQLHPHGVFLRAKNLHAGNAAGHGNPLRQQRLRVFVHRRSEEQTCTLPIWPVRRDSTAPARRISACQKPARWKRRWPWKSAAPATSPRIRPPCRAAAYRKSPTDTAPADRLDWSSHTKADAACWRACCPPTCRI